MARTKPKGSKSEQDVFYLRVSDVDESPNTADLLVTFEAINARSEAFWESPMAIYKVGAPTKSIEEDSWLRDVEEVRNSVSRYWESAFKVGNSGIGNRVGQHGTDPFGSMSFCRFSMMLSREKWRSLTGSSSISPGQAIKRWYKATVGSMLQSKGTGQLQTDKAALLSYNYVQAKPPTKNQPERIVTIYDANHVRRILTIKKCKAKLFRRLEAAFSSDGWQYASERDLQKALCKLSRFDQMIAFCVGQGNAIGLADAEGKVKLYCDFGKGVRNNAKTVPAHLTYCTCDTPDVILTHWHEDHMLGIQACPDMLDKTWIVPPIHTVTPSIGIWIVNICEHGGKILVFPQHKSCVKISIGSQLPANCQQRLYITRDTGDKCDVNNSGLAVVVKDCATELKWIMPGDADYCSLFDPIPAVPAVAVVASHHAGHTKGDIPKPASTKNSRILFSFGENNRYRHPKRERLNNCFQRGWAFKTAGLLTGTQDCDALSTAQQDYVSSPGRPKRITHVAATWGNIKCSDSHLECLGQSYVMQR